MLWWLCKAAASPAIFACEAPISPIDVGRREREEKISSSTFYQMGWRKFTFSYRTVRIRRVEMVLVYRRPYRTLRDSNNFFLSNDMTLFHCFPTMAEKVHQIDEKFHPNNSVLPLIYYT